MGKFLIYGSIATLKEQSRDLTQNYLCGKQKGAQTNFAWSQDSNQFTLLCQ